MSDFSGLPLVVTLITEGGEGRGVQQVRHRWYNRESDMRVSAVKFNMEEKDRYSTS